MEFTYKFAQTEDDLRILYDNAAGTGVLPAMYSCIRDEDWTFDLFKQVMQQRNKFIVMGFVDGVPGGWLELSPFGIGPDSRCAEVGTCGFRDWFHVAIPLCRGAFMWLLDHTDAVESFVGRVQAKSRHCLKHLEELGFKRAAKLDGMFWNARLQRWVPGWIVTATPDDIRNSGE